MPPTRSRTVRRTATIAIAFAALSCIALFIVYPEHVFHAALQGVRLWWTIVFPALLPFVILSEMAIATHFLQTIGAVINPLTRKLWGLPGSGGIAVAIGWTAGFPVAARITATLRRSGALTRAEGERMLALTHMCSPAFLVIVIATGMLHNPRAGWFLLLIQWLSLFLLGFIWNLLLPGHGRASHVDLPRLQTGHTAELSRPGHAQASTPTFGKMMGEAVKQAIDQLMMIGGVIIFFTVASVLLLIAMPFEPTDASNMLLKSLLELHVGANEIAKWQIGNYTWMLACLSAAFGWSGISAHVQMRALTQGTGFRYSRFLLARLLHGILAFALTFALAAPFSPWLEQSRQVFGNGGTAQIPAISHIAGTALLAIVACTCIAAALSLGGYGLHRWSKSAPPK